MKGSQIRLKLFLDKLKMPSQIKSLEDRKKIQKAIFIGQKAGANLGYSYGWYVYGPYSPELTKDYFTLNNDLFIGDKEYENYELLEDMSKNLEKIESILMPPPGVELEQSDWLELVASIIYYLEENKSEEYVRDKIKENKSHLFSNFDQAYKQICEYGLNS